VGGRRRRVSGAWAGSNSTDARGWKRVNISGLGGGRVGGGAARGGRGISDGGAVRSGGRACGEGRACKGRRVRETAARCGRRARVRRGAARRGVGVRAARGGERRGTGKLDSNRATEGFMVALFSSAFWTNENSGYFCGPADENIAAHENNHYLRK
jgi:hypothetical protein